MLRACAFLSWTFLAVEIIGADHTLLARDVVFPSGPRRLQAQLVAPDGSGPFPAVIFLHGGMGPMVGGDLETTVAALAKAGFVGFAPIRRNDRSLATNVQDVIAAMNYVKTLKNVDPQRLAVIGFSRGGLLAFMSSTRRRDLKAVVLMAPAHGRGTLRRFLAAAADVSAPTLILVARNDTKQADHVSISRQINATLKNAGKESRLIVYPSYGRDGHQLFFKVRSAYWPDVEKFLKSRLDK